MVLCSSPVPLPMLSGAGTLTYQELRQRYAPRVVVCQHCDVLIPQECVLERVERRCTLCLYACGLGQQADAARRHLLALLVRHAASISMPTPISSSQGHSCRSTELAYA